MTWVLIETTLLVLLILILTVVYFCKVIGSISNTIFMTSCHAWTSYQHVSDHVFQGATVVAYKMLNCIAFCILVLHQLERCFACMCSLQRMLLGQERQSWWNKSAQTVWTIRNQVSQCKNLNYFSIFVPSRELVHHQFGIH